MRTSAPSSSRMFVETFGGDSCQDPVVDLQLVHHGLLARMAILVSRSGG